MARKVKQSSPRLAAEVAAGETCLNDAYKEVRQAAKAQPEKQEKPVLSKTPVTLFTYNGQPVEYRLPKSKAKFNTTNEQVDWAKFTWNPVTGCLHDCKYCYAKEIAEREGEGYPVGFTPLFHHERLDAPSNTLVPELAKTDSRWRRVFGCSMADLYGKWVPDEWIQQVHAKCLANPQWDYLFLTKFPKRYIGLPFPETSWAGTTVDIQSRVEYAEEAFRQIKNVRVRWLSLEPLKEDLRFNDLSMFDWVVIGSQSATEQKDGYVSEFAPPFEWVARITAQAKEAGCRVYHKPNLLGVPNPQCAGMKLIQEEPQFLINDQDTRDAQGELGLAT
jgi:protein gp37